jgi:Domain of unknown function (DUF4157)
VVWALDVSFAHAPVTLEGHTAIWDLRRSSRRINWRRRVKQATTVVSPSARVKIRTRMAIQRCGGHPCPPSGCHQDDQQVSRIPFGQGQEAAPPIVHEVLRSPGSALPATLSRTMSARLGHDFAGVKLHTGAHAAQSAASVGAQAYTVGNHIVLGRSMPNPLSTEGERTLAHELTHVVQQREATATGQLPISNPADDGEREAVDVGARVAVSSPMSVQRHPDPQ